MPTLLDFHTHVAPAVDDGAETLSESKRMLLRMKETGVECAVVTPHFYPELQSLDAFLKARESAWETLTQISPAERPELLLGAEVAYFSSIGRARSLSEVCIRGTRILLLEMPFYPWNEAVMNDIFELVHTQGFQVVLGHIERYFKFGAKKYLQRLLNMGVFLQVNAETLLDAKARKTVLPLIRSGSIHLLGSDAHRAEGVRVPNLSEGFLALREIAPEMAEQSAELGRRLLGLCSEKH